MHGGETPLSVVVVSDFELSDKKSWRDELRVIKALGEQDIAQDLEVIIVEGKRHQEQPVPPELFATCKSLRLEYYDAESSAEMKDYGVSLAAGELIAVIEADCTPEPDWLRLLVEAAKANPQFVAVSGRTHYGEDTSYKRVLNLLDRSLNDTGRSGECYFISNNGAVYAADVLRAFPYQSAITPFLSAQLRNREMKRQGHRFYCERAALMRHEIGGLAFIRDYRMNMGHMQMELQERRSSMRIAGLLIKNFWDDLRRYWWLGRLYLRWSDWPLAALLLFWVRGYEALGMIYALREVPALVRTAYR